MGKTSQDDGGLLMLLPHDDSGGVAGEKVKSVSIGRRKGESCCWIKMAGFWYNGWGEATGVSKVLVLNDGWKGVEGELDEEDGRCNKSGWNICCCGADGWAVK